MTRADRVLLGLLYHRSWHPLELLWVAAGSLSERSRRESLARLTREGYVAVTGYAKVRVRITPAGRGEFARAGGHV